MSSTFKLPIQFWSFLIIISSWTTGVVIGQDPPNHIGPNQLPSFLPGGDFLRFTVSEDTPVGSVIYRLKGTDPENGELTFSISGEYFRVNKKTGDVTLIKGLDRENEASIDVIISLTDDGHGSEPSTVSIRREILVTDVNDNPPIFDRTPYNFKVSEKTEVESTVFSGIVVTDEDFGPNSEIRLTCDNNTSPLACDYFAVSAEPITEGHYIGIISLARPLDYEQHSTFALTLKSTDGLNTVSAPVAITIIDVQDQSPRFIGGPYVFQIPENSPPGTFVGEIFVQDGDTGNSRELQIKLIDEAQNDYFRLTRISRDAFTGSYSAVVETSESILDAEEEFIRENLGVYELTLEAREFPMNADDIEPTLVTRVGLAVMVIDEDDNLPTFDPPIYPQILRVPYNPDEVWGFPDFHVEVEDVDEEPAHAQFTLQFDWSLNPNDVSVDQVFAFVTPQNSNPQIQSKGIITMEVVNISLLEPGSKFNLEIGAYQRQHLVSKLNVPIEVAEGPKIRPIFNNTIYRVVVPEDIEKNDIITTVAVTNAHLIPGLQYSMFGTGADKFRIDPNSGQIRCATQKCLDFERERSHFFLVKAKASHRVHDEVNAVLYLETQGRNDETPTFPESTVTKRSVPDGTVTFDPPFFVAAKDADLNDELEYSVEDHTLNSSGIYIERSSGELKLRKPLSWAESGEHKLTVMATDKSGKSAFVAVLIIVLPVENIPPRFPYQLHKIEIPETTISGSSLFRTSAHDPDGQDAALRYFIYSQPEPDLFTIDERSGMIGLGKYGKLDFETKQKVYPVIIRVQDEGKPSEMVTTQIDIQITDVNDEAPKFSRHNYVVDVSESAKADHIVLQLSATDSDAGAKLDYSISCPCQVWDASGTIANDEDSAKYFSHLRVDPKLGNILLVTSLEHKLCTVMEFQATVRDRNAATPNQNDSAIVTIHITAAERLFPYFGEPWTPTNPWINLTIPEDMVLGSNVATLNAWDCVADEEISQFERVDADSEIFELIGNVLLVKNLLDYETKQNHLVSIKAVDSRGGESIANFGITLTDTNDHDPVFSKPEYKGKVVENSEFPTPILTVEASDRDDPENYGAIRYGLMGPQAHLFTIDPLVGVVQVAPGADIDREDTDFHTLFVLARDTPLGGPFQRTATATLRIQVTDVNDNDPSCRQKEEFLVPEDAQIGVHVGNISCSDPDEKPSLTYSLKDEANLNLFAINPKTGTVTVAKSLRGRGRSNPYNLNIVVEDGRDRSVSLGIEIKIANTIPNDGKPIFVNEHLSGEISEGAFRGTPVLHIEASDTDSFDNGEGRLVYRLLKQIYPCDINSNNKKVSRVEDVNYFRLDENTGMLTLQNQIDRETHDCITVLIGVEDLGIPPRVNSEWFSIHVTDLDDSLPILPKHLRNVHLTINETTPKDSEIFTFDVEDADIFPNNVVGFEISGGGGSEYFRLIPKNNQSAVLTLSNDLEKLETDELLMAIKCYPRERKVPLPECSSKVHIKINRDSLTSDRMINLNKKITEMILGVGTGVPVGNLVGNADMTPMKPIIVSSQFYHPNQVSEVPVNISEVLRIDSTTGDIYIWDNVEPFQNGHIRVELTNPPESVFSVVPIMKKRIKVFISSNSELLSTEMTEYPRLGRWIEEIQNFLNQPRTKSKINHGIFRLLTFDQTNLPEGKTMVCFLILENENMMSQEKSLQLLNTPDVQDIFLKHSFGDHIQKGCPQRIQGPAKLSLGGAPGRFWVEQSLVGIASVVGIATLAFITILCLVNRHKHDIPRKQRL